MPSSSPDSRTADAVSWLGSQELHRTLTAHPRPPTTPRPQRRRTARQQPRRSARCSPSDGGIPEGLTGGRTPAAAYTHKVKNSLFDTFVGWSCAVVTLTSAGSGFLKGNQGLSPSWLLPSLPWLPPNTRPVVTLFGGPSPSNPSPSGSFHFTQNSKPDIFAV